MNDFLEDRHLLSACEGRGHRAFQHIEFTNEGMRLPFGVILPHRHEIDVLAREHVPDIFEIGRKRIVRCQRNHHGAILAKLRLDCHGDG